MEAGLAAERLYCPVLAALLTVALLEVAGVSLPVLEDVLQVRWPSVLSAAAIRDVATIEASDVPCCVVNLALLVRLVHDPEAKVVEA